MRETFCIKCKIYKEFKKAKISTNCNKCGSEDEQIFIEEESIKILKILGSITNTEGYQKIYNHVRRKHKSRI